MSFFLPFVPESPRFLLIKKNDEERAKKGMEMTWDGVDSLCLMCVYIS